MKLTCVPAQRGLVRPSFAVLPTLLLLSLAIHFPFVVQQIAFPRLILLVIIVAAIILVSYKRRRGTRALRAPLIYSLYGLLIIIALLGGELSESGIANLQRYLILLPVAFLLGRTLSETSTQRCFCAVYVTVSAGVSILAGIERLTARSLFERDITYFVENGRARALVAADHPLVLAVLLLVAVPMCAYFAPRVRWLAVGILAVGIYSTGSEGPLGLLLLIAPVTLSSSAGSILARHRKMLATCLVVGALVLMFLSTFVWTAEVPGATSAEYSRGYRPALYSVGSQMLLARPLGYGFNAVPVGEWFLNTEYKGTRDVSISVDSEVVFLVAIFGFGGLLLLAVAAKIALLGLDTVRPFAISLLALLAAGTFLAITVWDSMCVVAGIVLGVCATSHDAMSTAPLTARNVGHQDASVSPPSSKENRMRSNEMRPEGRIGTIGRNAER